ncbi:MAG: GNAT family N-acetyltransferase [Deltaproteobacteria bacterium]|nr:GNAT family N-acetyltransferase [Deltaproteobacteria bacterium]
MTRAQSPLADATWIASFADAFGHRPTIHTLFEGERTVAALPMVRAGGVLSRAWVSLDNEHHPYWPIPGTLTTKSAERLLSRLLDTADYVFLRRLPMHDANWTALLEAACCLRAPVVGHQSDAGDARIALEGTWAELRDRLPKNFQRDLPRKQRQLEKLGRLELTEIRAPGAELDYALAACFDLETLGWKGSDGSPIVRDPRTLRFYGRIARNLAATGRFALYTLSLGDKIIAFEYCLRGGGHLEMLKLSFDPVYEKYSPGQVLRMMLLERELGRGDLRYYHLGRPSPWKMRWASEVAPLCTLRIYAGTPRAHAAYLLGPVVRTWIKASPIVRRLRRR